MDVIPGAEGLVAHRRIVVLLSCKLKWESYEMCGFVWARISLAIVTHNCLLLRGSQDKAAIILRRTDLIDGAVIALLVLSCG